MENLRKCTKCGYHVASEICWHCEFERVTIALEKRGARFIALIDLVDKYASSNVMEDEECDSREKTIDVLMDDKEYFLNKVFEMLESE